MREAEEIEGLRFPLAPGRSPLSRVAAELDQAGLVGVQRQAELRQPLPQIAEKPLGIRLPLEADDGVVGVADWPAPIGWPGSNLMHRGLGGYG